MTRKIIVAILLPISLTVLTGCASYTVSRRIDNVVSAYTDAARQVQLGDTKDQVLSLLDPIQDGLRPSERKPPDRFMSDKSQVEIYYFRSRRQADGLTTDDEFTPYVFRDGQLISIGWAALGGPSSKARSTQRVSAPSSQPRNQEPVTLEGHQKVYDAEECIGPVINGRCQGTILPNKAYHPTCHGEWVGGRCTGPMF